MFKQKYSYYCSIIEQFINKLPFDDSLLSRSMAYSLLGGGKRVRPVLALACAETVGGNPEVIVSAASALELIHTYSLIHDDLPCMDNDDYRRGKPSNHKIFGEATALLAGDALLTYGFELLAEPLPVPPEKQLWVIKETAQAVGWKGMVGGQVLDTIGEIHDLNLSEIENIHKLKTGALLQAAARLGAILGGGSKEEIEDLSNYALYLGLAFQIKDDILDVEGDSKVLGKPVGSDQRRNKSTYPSLLGVGGAKECLVKTVEMANNCLTKFGDKALFLSELADYVANRSS